MDSSFFLYIAPIYSLFLLEDGILEEKWRALETRKQFGSFYTWHQELEKKVSISYKQNLLLVLT